MSQMYVKQVKNIGYCVCKTENGKEVQQSTFYKNIEYLKRYYLKPNKLVLLDDKTVAKEVK